MTEPQTNNHLGRLARFAPLWLQFIASVGLPGYLVIFLLGGIPGLPSPIQLRDQQIIQLQAIILEQYRTIQLRDQALRELNTNILSIVRKVCKGAWRGVATRQEECDEVIVLTAPRFGP